MEDIDQWIDRQVSYRCGSMSTPLLSSIDDVDEDPLYESRNKIVRPIVRSYNIDGYVSMRDMMDTPSTIIRFNRPYGTNYGVLWPLPSYDAQNLVSDTIGWDEKEDVLFWRGATSGTIDDRINPIRYINSRDWPIKTDCYFSTVIQGRENDVDGVLGSYTPIDEWFRYKYLLNLHGNDVSSSFPFTLYSNSVALHPYPFKWEVIYYGDGIKPWVHFIPLRHDLSDLEEKLIWCKNNDDECKRIAERATNYMRPYTDPLLYKRVLERVAKRINT